MSGDNAITRRVLIGQLACLAVRAQNDWAQTDDDPLRQLHPAHPRLILLDSDLDRLRGLIRDNPLAHRIYLDLEKECGASAHHPPSEYKLTGPRLRAVSRRVLDRVSTLALMYRITQREPYSRRAVAELRAAAAFRDWNPAVFTDTAEMTHAFAIGYDWLYNALSPEDRALIRDAIVSKALDQALPIYQREAGWVRDHYNANIICNAGMGLGALAIAGDSAPDKDKTIDDKCGAVLRYAFDSIPHGLATYGVEGSWPEGPAYWESVTIYACAFFAALQTALGNDYGLSAAHGVDRAGRFRIYTTGPTGKAFNFADSVEDAGARARNVLAGEALRESRFRVERAEAARTQPAHPDAYDLAWFDRDGKSPQQPPPWPLDAIFRGVDIACFRSAWDDPNALFLAVKGGDNKAAHAHLDLGSFVLDAGGVRWASDLGTGRLRSSRILRQTALDVLPDPNRSPQHPAHRRPESGSARRSPHHPAGVRARLQLGADRFIPRQRRPGETVAAAFRRGAAASRPDRRFRPRRSAGRSDLGNDDGCRHCRYRPDSPPSQKRMESRGGDPHSPACGFR